MYIQLRGARFTPISASVFGLIDTSISSGLSLPIVFSLWKIQRLDRLRHSLVHGKPLADKVLVQFTAPAVKAKAVGFLSVLYVAAADKALRIAAFAGAFIAGRETFAKNTPEIAFRIFPAAVTRRAFAHEPDAVPSQRLPYAEYRHAAYKARLAQRP